MMSFEASDKSKFCVGDADEEHLNFKWLASFDKKTSHSSSSEDFESEGDDDVPLSAMFPQIMGLRTCNNNNIGSVKKRDTTTSTTLPVKRMLIDNSNAMRGSIKKSKVSPSSYDDNGDGGDANNLPISSRIKMPAMSTDKSFSSLKKELTLVEKSFEDCKRKRQVEEERLQSIKRDIQECCKDLENKKKEIIYVGNIDEARKKIQGKIEECVKDFVAKEAQLYLMEDLIGERNKELKTKEIELHQFKDNISKQKHFKRQMKEFESKEKEFEIQVKELVNDLISKQKHFKSRMKELESIEKQHEGRVKEHESKKRDFEERVKELESEKKSFESQVE